MRYIRKQNSVSFLDGGNGASSRPPRSLSRAFSIENEVVVVERRGRKSGREGAFFPSLSGRSSTSSALVNPSMELLRRHRTTTSLLRTLDQELAQMNEALSQFQTKDQHSTSLREEKPSAAKTTKDFRDMEEEIRQLPVISAKQHSVETESISGEQVFQQQQQQQLNLNVVKSLPKEIETEERGVVEEAAETEPSSSTSSMQSPSSARVNLRIHLTRSQSPSIVESNLDSDDWTEPEQSSVVVGEESIRIEGGQTDLQRIQDSSDRGHSITSNLEGYSANVYPYSPSSSQYARQIQSNPGKFNRKITSAGGRSNQGSSRPLTTTTVAPFTSSSNNSTTALFPGNGGGSNGNGTVLSAYTSLSLRRRSPTPLIRAMSAPVKTPHIHPETETMNKNVFLNVGGGRRKVRRRKTTTTLSSSKTNNNNNIPEVMNDYDLSVGIGDVGIRHRKHLTRTRSLAPDVETLVSLLSSEGSESEKEEPQTKDIYQLLQHGGSGGGGGCGGGGALKRAPTLRKAGKSVSFQETGKTTPSSSSLLGSNISSVTASSLTPYLSNKDYLQILRHGFMGSMMANRQRLPPEKEETTTTTKKSDKGMKLMKMQSMFTMNAGGGDSTSSSSSSVPSSIMERDDGALLKSSSETEITHKSREFEFKYPEYVRTLKERECWKLYLKMSAKGVSIAYDTILRGMLTPTEFRSLQKYRQEQEEAAAQQALKEQEGEEEGVERVMGKTTRGEEAEQIASSRCEEKAAIIKSEVCAKT